MMIFYQFNLTIHPYMIVIIKPMQRYENMRYRIKINSNVLCVRNVSLRKELYRSILGLTSIAKMVVKRLQLDRLDSGFSSV